MARRGVRRIKTTRRRRTFCPAVPRHFRLVSGLVKEFNCPGVHPLDARQRTHIAPELLQPLASGLERLFNDDANPDKLRMEACQQRMNAHGGLSTGQEVVDQ